MTQQTTYDDVPVYTGQPPATQGGNAAGFFQPPAPAAEGILATDQARAVAEVQAALVIAASRPRNELRARDRLLQACQRASLAEGATYTYERGGTKIYSASIRLAETAARAWGNMTYGFHEISRRMGESDVVAFAWDLETNTKVERKLTVRHKRDVGKGSKDVSTERDIYEVIANQAQRRVRATILEIIPGDIIDDALEQCEKTLKANIGNPAEAAAKLVDAFSSIGVSREAIEKRLGHRVDAIQPAQIIAFRKIYTSIKDGMSEPKDWFELASPADNGQEAGKPAQAAPVAPEKPATGKRPSGKSKQEAAPAPAASQPEPEATEAAAQGPALSHDPETGELYGPAASLITCPNSGKKVDELDCVRKSCHDGCPQFEL